MVPEQQLCAGMFWTPTVLWEAWGDPTHPACATVSTCPEQPRSPHPQFCPAPVWTLRCTSLHHSRDVRMMIVTVMTQGLRRCTSHKPALCQPPDAYSLVYSSPASPGRKRSCAHLTDEDTEAQQGSHTAHRGLSQLPPDSDLLL